MKPRSDGVTLIALYHLISGFLSLLGMCGLFGAPVFLAVMAPYSDNPSGTEGGVVFMAIIGLICGGLMLLLTAANWIVAWGLWKRLEWSRTAAIVLAVFRLFNIPLGTIIGGLIIWYLLREDVKSEFVAVG